MRGHAQRIFHVARGALEAVRPEFTSEERDTRVSRRLCGRHTQELPHLKYSTLTEVRQRSTGQLNAHERVALREWVFEVRDEIYPDNVLLAFGVE